MLTAHESKSTLITVFTAYAQEDREHAAELAKHLKPYCNQGIMDLWYRALLKAGDDCRQEASKLEGADVILMLISPDFMASDECVTIQQRAMERLEAGYAKKVIPIKLRTKVPDSTPFSHLAPLPRHTEPILSRTDRDQAWTEVAEGVRSIVYDLRASYFEQPAAVQEPTSRRDRRAASGFINEGERFTLNLGHGTGFLYRPGPLVLTYIQPKATLAVSSGPPWLHEDDAPLVINLTGDSFRGEFFVEHRWSIYGRTKKCICSGFYPYQGLPLADGEYHLENKAIFFHYYGKRWTIVVPKGSNLEERKDKAIKEAEQLVKVHLHASPEWVETKINGGGIMTDVDPQY